MPSAPKPFAQDPIAAEIIHSILNGNDYAQIMEEVSVSNRKASTFTKAMKKMKDEGLLILHKEPMKNKTVGILSEKCYSELFNLLIETFIENLNTGIDSGFKEADFTSGEIKSLMDCIINNGPLKKKVAGVKELVEISVNRLYLTLSIYAVNDQLMFNQKGPSKLISAIFSSSFEPASVLKIQQNLIDAKLVKMVSDNITEELKNKLN